MFKDISVYRLTKIAMIAAIYVVLTVFLKPISYGVLQFRIAEVLVLLCFYNKDYCVSMILGCAIANLYSDFAFLDVPFGTLATIIAVILMWKSKSIWLAAIFPVIINGIIVGAILSYCLNIPLISTMIYVAGGELGVLIVGIVLFKVLEKNKGFMRLLNPQKLGFRKEVV